MIIGEKMIIEDKVKLKRKIKKVNGKLYQTYFVSFSIKYTPILSAFKELHNVEILTDTNRIVLDKANLFIYSHYKRKKSGERIPQYSITVPKHIAEQLWKKGIRKLKVIVELPDLVAKS